MLGCYLAAATVAAVVPGLQGAGAVLITGTLLASLAAIAVWLAAPRLRNATPAPPVLARPPTRVLFAGPSMRTKEPFPETERLAHRLRFDQQLERALGDAEDRRALAEVVTRALGVVPPEAPAEWLQLGSRGRALIQVAEIGPDGEGPGCPVIDPDHCEAIRRDRTLRFHGDELDACRHLVDRSPEPCSAVCIPVRVQGEARGVLHRTGDEGRAPGDLEVGYLESMAAKLGSRLAVLSLQSSDVSNGTIDRLTGLLSADGLEAKIRQLARDMTPSRWPSATSTISASTPSVTATPVRMRRCAPCPGRPFAAFDLTTCSDEVAATSCWQCFRPRLPRPPAARWSGFVRSCCSS